MLPLLRKTQHVRSYVSTYVLTYCSSRIVVLRYGPRTDLLIKESSFFVSHTREVEEGRGKECTVIYELRVGYFFVFLRERAAADDDD